MESFSTWLEIDLDAIRKNVQYLRTQTGAVVMAIVKANAYGHGLVEVARAASSAGAAWLGVARIDEALALRRAEINTPILVMGDTAPERVPEAVANHISLGLHFPEMIPAYAAQARSTGQPLCVHAKLDSGMGRLGVFPEEGMGFLYAILEHPEIKLEGMYTHFARADEPEQDTTRWQLERFTRLVHEVEAAGIRPALIHAANSAAALYFPGARFDMVRPGIAIYGLQPSSEAPLTDNFRPALTWKARLASIKELPENYGIGYGHRYTTSKQERIGVIQVGYADGLRRRLGNIVLVGGKRVPVVGGVCMDQCMISLDSVPTAKIGDEVVLIGSQGNARISAEEIGQAWGSVNYDVVCGLSARVTRIYHG